MTVPTGTLGLAKLHLRQAIADSATFRTWVGATSQAQALERIYYDKVPDPADGEEHTLEEGKALRPCVIVWHVTSDSPSVASNGSTNTAQTLQAHFEWQVPDEIRDDSSEVAIRLDNTIDAIRAEMRQAKDQNGHLYFENDAIAEPYKRSDPDDIPTYGDYATEDITFSWRGI